MKKIVLFVFVVALWISAVGASAQNIDVFYHTVERGQTVYSIAKMYEVSVDDIYRLNFDSEDHIRAGSVLKIPQKSGDAKPKTPDSESGEYIYHTIQAKETLFGVSRKYSVDGEHIVEANPGLSHTTFAIDKIIRIPINKKRRPTAEIIENTHGAREIYYTVPPKETLYNIYSKFKTSEKELLKLNPELAGGLRIGMILRIPLNINERDLPKDAQPDAGAVNAMLQTKQTAQPVATVKVAVLLPFEAGKQPRTAEDDRMVEYYEGFLLALDSLRKLNTSTIELFSYDIGEGTAGLQKILRDERKQLENVHLIIGGKSDEQIKILASFAKNNRIKYVIPFPSKNDEVLNNAYVFQIYAPQNYLYANAAYAAANLYAKHNIIFLETNDQSSQADFIKEFKTELKDRNVAWKDAVYDVTTFEANIKALLSTDKPNVVMPVSSSVEALKKIKDVLRLIAETKPEYQLSLFGYPAWQLHTKECLNEFYALNARLYTPFYVENLSAEAKSFNDAYKNWYSKTPNMSMFPKYAMLGFDSGMFFLGAIQRYGAEFEDHLSDIRYKSLQTGFNFERVNNWGGFINTNIYIVNYKKDYTITRSNFK